MKKIIIIILNLIFYHSVYANEKINLNFNISNANREYPHYLCIYNTGCFNLLAVNKKYQVFTPDMKNIKKIVLMNQKNKQLYFQPLPNSCQVELKENKNITFQGKIVIKNTIPYIENLNCLVT